jgi:copper(I)-binding protein
VRSAAEPRRPAASPEPRVPTRPVRRRVAALVAAALVGTPVLAACASGTDAMTNLTRTTTNTTAGAVGTISLRNVYVAGPVEKGGSAQIISAIFNGGADQDTLIGVSSPDASGGKPGDPATLPPGGGRIYIADGSAPSLTGVRKKLLIGAATKITFVFAKAGSVTLDVPVETPAPGASGSPAATPSASAPPVSGTPGASLGTPGTLGTTASPTATATPSAGATATATTATPSAPAGG